MRYLLEKLYAIGIDKKQVIKMAPNAVQIMKEDGSLILSKGEEGKFNIISVLERKTEKELSTEEVLEIVEECK